MYGPMDGERHVDVNRSEQGTRMGCIFGTIGFCLCVGNRIYSKLAEEFPEFVQRALTDDAPAFIQPPADGDWQPLFTRYPPTCTGSYNWARP